MFLKKHPLHIEARYGHDVEVQCVFVFISCDVKKMAPFIFVNHKPIAM